MSRVANRGLGEPTILPTRAFTCFHVGVTVHIYLCPCPCFCLRFSCASLSCYSEAVDPLVPAAEETLAAAALACLTVRSYPRDCPASSYIYLA
eukprot:1768483-Pyramimonas_sp.AAC.1